jgi:PPOX class probable F420-dependent enzyme
MWTLLAWSMLAFAVAAAATQFTPDVQQALETSKQLYVATRRADGSTSAVAPIWFMFDGDAVYFTTTPDSHKAKRIVKGSPVLVWVGSSQGPHFVGHGEIIRDPAQAERMAPVYDQKYWISWLGFFRPRADRIRDGSTVIVRVTPVAGG